MNIVYNTQDDISSNLNKFFSSVDSTLSKPHLKLISPIILSMIQAESVVTSDIVKNLKGSFLNVKPSSNTRRLERFFNNPNFDVYHLFDSIISHVISNFKFDDPFVHISIDHMFCKDDFSILMFSLRIGKQGFPLWFRCFKGAHNPDAFDLSLINQGISHCFYLFNSIGLKVIFLADRWFNLVPILKHIDSIGASYFIRSTTQLLIDIPSSPDRHLISHISDIEPSYSRSLFFPDVFITKDKFHTNLTISSSKGYDEPWYILTNSNPKEAIRNYKYRFGSIEFLFKNQKSNRFLPRSYSI